MDSSDLSLPHVILVQPGSDSLIEQGGVPGEWFDTLSGPVGPTLDVVPLMWLSKRRKRKEPGSNVPSCQSFDALVPADRVEAPYCDRCAVMRGTRMVEVCPEALWGADRTPPSCKIIGRFVAQNLETHTPCIVSCSSTGYGLIKQLFSFHSLRRVPLYAVAAKIVGKKTKNTKGTFFVNQFAKLWTLANQLEHKESYEAIKGIDFDGLGDATDELEQTDEVDAQSSKSPMF